MQSFENIQNQSLLKVLGDAKRWQILRLLMSASLTLSHLGDTLEMHPAKVRHHLLQLQQAGLVELVSTKVTGGYTEKFYQASAKAYLVRLPILPHATQKGQVLAPGSNDMALELLADALRERQNAPDIYPVPVGSLDGLIALRQGFGQMAGCHLIDPASGEYNLAAVHTLFPGEKVYLVTLAHRQQGLIVAAGNPKDIYSLHDLTRPDIHFINRASGSGTRVWLDEQLRQQAISPEQIKGYTQVAHTHLQVAHAIQHGQADAGVGLLAAAHRSGLDFIPLFAERFDLAIPDEHYHGALLRPILDHLQTAAFRQAVSGLSGYDPQQSGQEIPT